MANFATLRRSKLPDPPAPTETRDKLRAPEVAPGNPRISRATGRTYQLNTRVRESFHTELKEYGAKHRIKLNELLEQAFEALKAQRANR